MTKKTLSRSLSTERNVYASKSAGTFNVYSARWVLSFSQPNGLVIPDLGGLPSAQKEALLRTMAERATKYEAGSIRSDFSALKKLTKVLDSDEEAPESGITVDTLIRWFASDVNTETKTYTRRIILHSAELGFEKVFEEGVLSLAKQFDGKRSRFHPDRFEPSRSFTESERKQVFYQLARGSYLGTIPALPRIATTLTLITGKRPIQLANSKFMDFSLENISLGQNDNRSVILYNAPVAKQRGQVFRSKFNTMPITSSFEIWADIERLRTENRNRIKQLFGIELSEEQSLLLPLFLPYSDDDLIQRFIEGCDRSDMSLHEFLISDRLHIPGGTLSWIISQINKYMHIVSDYTGHPLRINAKRFRHTRATKLALDGSSIEEIADALDHSDNRSARIYVDNLPTRAVKIGAQVEETLGVLAKKFSGLPVENSNQVINLYTKHGTENVGICGMETFCKENYPIACYECELFNPNPFGNHSAVQEYVEEQLVEANRIGDNRLIENWNTILLAVLERRYVADQQRIQILNESPETLRLEQDGEYR